MRIVLREDVSGIGKQGDIVTVADGHARNHLIPKGLAYKSTPGAERAAERTREIRRLQDVREKEVAEEMAGRLSATTLAISAKASEEGKLYGSVTVTDIISELSKQLKIELDRSAVQLDHPIRELGEHKVPLSLHEEVDSEVLVAVSAEK